MLYLLSHQQFLPASTLITVSILLVMAGALFTKGAMDLYAALLLFALAGVFFLMRDYFPPNLVYLIAIALLVAGIFSINKGSGPGFNFGMQIALLLAVVIFSKIYFPPIILLHLALITIMVLAFIFLI